MDALTFEIYARLKWFISLRWIAILGTFFVSLGFELAFKIQLFSPPYIAILIAMLIGNIWFLRIIKKISFKRSNNKYSIYSLTGFANLQIGLDLIFLSLLWHFSGGVESPILFFFVFHMIIASILLPKINSIFWSFFSSTLIISIALFEYMGILSHHNIICKLTKIELWNNLYWNFFILTPFCFTLVCVVYMTASIAKRLRQRNKEIIALEKTIADKKLQDAKKKLYFSEKMAALGKLSAGIAHEINNPLTTILSYSECLADEVQDENLKKDIELIVSETIRIRGIVKKVLNFSHAGDQSESSKDLPEVDMNQEVIETLSMVSGQMNFINITIEKKFNDSLPKVKVGRPHLKQVIINILVNASQSMNGKGNIVVQTDYDKQKHMAFIKFIDNGPGIKPEELSRIFDPFYTTKKQGEGTGLGLSVSYGLMELYNGKISVKSTYGKGATFTLSLPFEQN